MRRMYSENQIKNIVQDGIDNGQIVAGGGTQLYKHQFQIEDANANLYSVILINDIEEAITRFSNWGNIIRGTINEENILLAFTPSDSLAYLSINANVEWIDFTDASLGNDEVVKL